MKVATIVASMLGMSLMFVAACTSSSLKTAGEACVASSECGAGLLCNLEATPSVCAMAENTMDVDANVDAFMHPLIDGSGSSKPPVDAKPPIDAALDAAIDAM